MLLENGGEARYDARLRVFPPSPPPSAELLILDGQQQLTTLAHFL